MKYLVFSLVSFATLVMKRIVIPRMVVILTQRQTLISAQQEQTPHSMTDDLMLYLKMWDRMNTILEALPKNLYI